MTLLVRLLTASNAYCHATGLSRSRVSTLVLKGGKRLDDLADGNSDIATRTYERAMQWFSDHWPDGADWPKDVARPPASSVAAQGAATDRPSDRQPIEVSQ